MQESHLPTNNYKRKSTDSAYKKSISRLTGFQKSEYDIDELYCKVVVVLKIGSLGEKFFYDFKTRNDIISPIL